MSMDTVFIKRGDLLPELTAQFTDSAGALNITGATVKFIMVNRWSGGTPKINTAAIVVTASTGNVKYTWAGTDTDTAGEYVGEFEATIAAKKLTAPNNGNILITILEDLA
jgi:hypothetical protein